MLIAVARRRSSIAEIACPAVTSRSGTVSREPTTNASSPSDASRSQRGKRGGRVLPHAQLDQLAAEAIAEGGGGVEGDDPPLVHDRDPVAEPFRLVQIVRRQQDRQLVARAQPRDHVQQLLADARVEADRRLVEEEDAGPGDERAADLESPPLAAAVAGDGPVEELAQAERVRGVGDARSRRTRVRAPQARVDLEVAPPGERAVDDRLLEDDAAHPPRSQRVPRDVEPGEARGAARRPHRRRQHPDRRRLAGAVRAEQAEDLAGAHVELDPFDGLHAARIHLP